VVVVFPVSLYFSFVSSLIVPTSRNVAFNLCLLLVKLPSFYL